MTRRAAFVLLSMSLVMIAPSDAAAKSWWGWLEEFSGPGPFNSANAFQNRHLTLGCRSRQVERVTQAVQLANNRQLQAQLSSVIDARPRWSRLGTPVVTASPQFGGNVVLDSVLCFYFDQTTYRAEPSRGFPAMEADTLDFGFSLFLAGPFELGAGAGAVWFEPRNGGGSRTLPLVTPLRVQIRPLGTIKGRNEIVQRLLNAPKFYLKLSAIFGEITAADFGIDAPDAVPTVVSSFRSDGDLVASYGFVVDAGELLGLIPKLR